MTKIFNYILLATLVLTVLLLVPFSDAFVFDTKKLVLLVAGLAIVGATAFQLWKSKSVVITMSPFCLGLTGFAVAVIASTLFANSYPYEALFGWGGVFLFTTIVAGLGHELITKKETTNVPLVLGGTAAVLAVLSVLQTFGVGPSRVYNLAFGTSFPHNALFNLTESTVVALQVLVVAAIGLAGYYFQKRDRATKPLFMAMAAAIVIGAAVMGWATFLNKDTKVTTSLPLSANVAVIKGIMKSPKSALIGLGPNSFAHAYNIFRPASINATPVWGAEFANGVDLPLTLLPTLGLLGLVSWAALVVFIVRQVIMHKDAQTEPLTWTLVALIVTQLVFPPTIIMVVLFGVVLAYWLATQSASFEKIKMHTLITRLSPDHSKAASVSITHILSIGLSVLLGLFIVASLYGAGRAFASANLFYRSSMALAKNESASKIYELQKQAVAMNPYIDINRRRYALTNLAVAQALAAKSDITDPERQQVLLLIQQAIREGRAATMIEPEDARNWEALATIYQNLMSVATGADQWTVNSLSRAIEKDPVNPTLWFQLGSTFYQNQQYSEAARIFAQAAQLKPDYLNAYYNWANALRMNKEYANSKQVYEQLMTKVGPTSAEYNTVKSELAVVNGLLAEQSKNKTASSSAATTTPSVVEESLNTSDKTVPSTTTDLTTGAKQYLDATPVQQ